MYATERDLADNAGWKVFQKNAFTRWANEHLRQVNKVISDLDFDMHDGVRLCALVEVLSGKKLPNYNRRPSYKNQKLENVSICLNFLQTEEGIKLVNIDSSDIVGSNSKLIFGLMWTLILHYSISIPMWDGLEDASINNPTPRQKLLGWISSRIPDKPICNFTTDWNDGTAIGALVDAVAPGLCPNWTTWSPTNSIANATEAMTAAEQWLDVPQLIKPVEMCNLNLDELSMMTYLSQFPNAKLKQGSPLHPRTNLSSVIGSAIEARKCYVTGRGVQPKGIRVNDLCDFTVHTENAAGDAEVIANFLGSDGVEEELTMKKLVPRTVEYSYAPKRTGEYVVTITYGAQEVARSPFRVEVEPKKDSKIREFGPGLQLGIVGYPACFTVDTNGETSALGFSIEGPTKAKIDCKDNGDGSADISYWPTADGEYAVHILCEEEDIPRSPFMVYVSPYSTEFYPTKVEVRGPGILKTGVQVSKWAEFVVDTRKADHAPLNVVVLEAYYHDVEVVVTDNNDGTYNCRYMPRRCVKHIVFVSYGNVAVPNSPFRVLVQEASYPSRVKVFGPAVDLPVRVHQSTHLVIDCSEAGPVLDIDKKLTSDIDSKSGEKRFHEEDFREMIQLKVPFVGKGGYGEVYGPHNWENNVCAVKRIMFGTATSKEYEEARNACERWMSLQHKNIIPVYSVTIELPALYIVMEFGSGESLDIVLKKCTSALPDKILTNWSIQIAEGMAYLHQNKIVHRDLKSANIVVMEPDAASYPYGKTLKITDFDHIRELDDTRTMTQFGTYAWMAFEVIDKSKFSKKSDVYSYGVVLWEMLSLKVPYEGLKGLHNFLQTREKLKIKDSWPATLKTIHKRCMNNERAARPSFSEILRVLQDPCDQLHEIWANEGQEEGLPSLNNLPLEMLDIILQKSYLHWTLKSQTKPRDEDVIRTVISVDVCFNRRISRRQFKRSIWRYLKAFYHELDRKIAILKNNKSYVINNIRTQGLIKQLRSADCLSDIKARLIGRKPVKTVQPKLSKLGPDFGKSDTAELLHAVQLFDDARLSTFINCLRHSNQKLLARIAETGGVVVQTSIATRAETMKQLLLEDFNDLRHKYRPRSHDVDKLISQLKDRDIEVLNAIRNNHIALWIWCKSQKGLDNLRDIDESNVLRNVLIALTRRSSSPEVHTSAVVSICHKQFYKKVAVRELAIEITKSLNVSVFVRGVTKLRNEIYVLYGSNKELTPAPALIGVYQDDTPFNIQITYTIKECRLSCDIASCEKENCLYIGDLRTESIWKIKITPRKTGQYEAFQWLTSICKPFTMSTSSDGQLLLIEESDLPFLATYGTDAKLLRRIQLPDVIKCPHHAVETSVGDFIVIDELKDEGNEDSSSRSEKKSVWSIYQVTSDGKFVIRSKELSSETQAVKDPLHISLFSDDRVFVASSKVFLLHSDFRVGLYGGTQTFESGRLFYDDEKRQLIVGGIGTGVYVYRLTMK